MKYLEGDLSIESDCEGESPGVDEEIPNTKEEKEEQLRAILIAGSFPAWKSLFFYRCTDEILFAPLRSQGVDSRLKHIREKTVAAAPPPCSPKSIYVLANLLEINPLCDTALADIKSKVSSENVVEEVFSWVTATQEKIMEVESAIFIQNLKDRKLITLVSDNIGRISKGTSSHCANVLMLGLERGVKSKKLNKGVLLRCPRNYCSRRNSPVSYLSLGSSTYCTNCGCTMQCAGCGHTRCRSDSSCQGCKKRFL